MKITNRSDQIYTWYLWGAGDSMEWFVLDTEWIHPGQTHTLDIKGPVKINYLDGQTGIRKSPRDSETEILEPKFEILIQGSWPDYVVWSSIREQYIKSQYDDSVKSNLSKSAALASSGLRATAEFMKLLPVVGTVFSGILGIASAISDGVAKGSSITPEKQTLLDEIAKIVRDEEDLQAAQKAAAAFLNAYFSLKDVDPNDFGPHELKDLLRDTEEFCSPAGEFMNYITLLNNDINKSKRVTNAYLMGISAYMKYLWLHFITSINDGDAISAGKLQRYKTKIQECRDGVQRLKNNASAVELNIATCGLRVEPEITMLRQALYMQSIGLSGLNEIDIALDSLRLMVAYLDEDIASVKAGKAGLHYFKSNWQIGSGSTS
ncbi:MAG: hypothetical protein Q8R44_00565 [Novosphingobium sp.]|nr:hypothetical protein [Novosphingobium sp.]